MNMKIMKKIHSLDADERIKLGYVKVKRVMIKEHENKYSIDLSNRKFSKGTDAKTNYSEI